MDFAKLTHARYSCRSYRPDPVPEEMVQKVLEAAAAAPTAVNRQPFRILVIGTKGREAELGRIYARDWFVQPPLILCICVETEAAWRRRQDGKSYGDVDAAIAFDHLILAATELGLGTCWIAAFDPAAAREVLALPEGVEPLVFTPLGFAADAPAPKKRKELGEIVRRERW